MRVKLEEVPPGNTEDPEVMLDPPSRTLEPFGDEGWEGKGGSDPEEEEEEERNLQETGNGVEGKHPHSNPPPIKMHIGQLGDGGVSCDLVWFWLGFVVG